MVNKLNVNSDHQFISCLKRRNLYLQTYLQMYHYRNWIARTILRGQSAWTNWKDGFRLKIFTSMAQMLGFIIAVPAGRWALGAVVVCPWHSLRLDWRCFLTKRCTCGRTGHHKGSAFGQCHPQQKTQMQRIIITKFNRQTALEIGISSGIEYLLQKRKHHRMSCN